MNWVPKSLPETNEKVLDLLSRHDPWRGKILDLGAGEGYFSSLVARRCHDEGVAELRAHLKACDLFPEEFKFDGVACDRCDFNAPFPYANDTFDAVCSIEVVEHLENAFHFMRETFRILRPGGVAVVTTPNVLNVNSRLTTFVTGFPLLYGPLPLSSRDPQHLGGHINPVSLYYLVYFARVAGFREVRIHTDRRKRSAGFLAALLYLPIKLAERLLFSRMKRRTGQAFADSYELVSSVNSLDVLLGRTLIVEAVK